MDIAGLRLRIMIQKTETVVDRIGNHRSVWRDYFRCWATASGGAGSESEETGHTVESETMDFTVRYCPETAAVTAKGYRVTFGDRIYNILHVDDMRFRHNSMKLRCERVER